MKQKLIAHISPDRTFFLQVHPIAFWFMERFGFRTWSEKTSETVKGKNLSMVIYDEVSNIYNYEETI